MVKKAPRHFEDFLNAMRDSYETGHSDPRLVRKLTEMAKHLDIKLSIKKK
jgi:hypothetical protein